MPTAGGTITVATIAVDDGDAKTLPPGCDRCPSCVSALTARCADSTEATSAAPIRVAIVEALTIRRASPDTPPPKRLA